MYKGTTHSQLYLIHNVLVDIMPCYQLVYYIKFSMGTCQQEAVQVILWSKIYRQSQRGRSVTAANLDIVHVIAAQGHVMVYTQIFVIAAYGINRYFQYCLQRKEAR